MANENDASEATPEGEIIAKLIQIEAMLTIGLHFQARIYAKLEGEDEPHLWNEIRAMIESENQRLMALFLGRRPNWRAARPR